MNIHVCIYIYIYIHTHTYIWNPKKFKLNVFKFKNYINKLNHFTVHLKLIQRCKLITSQQPTTTTTKSLKIKESCVFDENVSPLKGRNFAVFFTDDFTVQPGTQYKCHP